jgi:hypothetical protein
LGDLVTDPDRDEPADERQMRMMAYIDDELTPAERESFELELERDRALALEVVEYQSLAALSSAMRIREPTDQERRRFWARFYNRTEWRIGWALLGLGMLGVLLSVAWEIWVTDRIPVHVKVAVGVTCVGFVLILWNVMRLKWKTDRFDRYRGVLR